MRYRNWMFGFGLVGALGGLACILQWAEIKPKDLLGWHMSLAIPQWFWLLFGFLLFSLSIGLSVYTLFRTKAPISGKLPEGLDRTIDKVVSSLPQQQGNADETSRLREHLRDAEQRADRLLKESKQLDDEKATLEKNNQELKARISEVEQRWNNSALLSGQFLQEAARLSGELIFLWLREHCPTKTQFSSIHMAENLGISRDAALHGLELLQREYRLVVQPLPNVDGWEYVPSLTALQPTLKATTRLQQGTIRGETIKIVSICLVRFRVDESTICRGKTLKLRYEVLCSEDFSDRIWLGATLVYKDGGSFSSPPQDKPVDLLKGTREYDRDFTVPANAPVGKHTLGANVWRGPLSDPNKSNRLTNGGRVDIVVVG